jgi:hypothetical protein
MFYQEEKTKSAQYLARMLHADALDLFLLRAVQAV